MSSHLREQWRKIAAGKPFSDELQPSDRPAAAQEIIDLADDVIEDAAMYGDYFATVRVTRPTFLGDVVTVVSVVVPADGEAFYSTKSLAGVLRSITRAEAIEMLNR